MEKKIIAVALVIVVMVTAFVGCGQKYKTTKIGNKEYLLHTDAEGNTVMKDDQLVAVVTDRDGEIITYENGENQTYYIDLPQSYIEGDGYSFILDDKNWVYDIDRDMYFKDGKNKDVAISISEFETTCSSLDEYMAEIEEDSEKYIEAIKEKYPKTEVSITDGKVTSGNLDCKIAETKIEDDKGIFYYGYVVDFMYKGKVIAIEFVSQNYTYEETDVLKIFNESFVFVNDK